MSSRREFFKRFIKPIDNSQEEESSPPIYIRPPYVADYSLFDRECIECEDKGCAKVCDENIIVIEAKGTPILNFTNSGCTFCQECAFACLQRVSYLLKMEKRR